MITGLRTLRIGINKRVRLQRAHHRYNSSLNAHCNDWGVASQNVSPAKTPPPREHGPGKVKRFLDS